MAVIPVSRGVVPNAGRGPGAGAWSMFDQDSFTYSFIDLFIYSFIYLFMICLFICLFEPCLGGDFLKSRRIYPDLSWFARTESSAQHQNFIITSIWCTHMYLRTQHLPTWCFFWPPGATLGIWTERLRGVRAEQCCWCQWCGGLAQPRIQALVGLSIVKIRWLQMQHWRF